MKKTLIVFLTIFSLLSCGNTKYTILYEKEKNIDFSQGKWILNEPLTNNENGRIEYIALKGFKEILKDSLFELKELRKDRLISPALPFDLSEKELKDLKIGTDCDFLISIKSIIVKNEMGSFANVPNIGSTIKTNQAESTIRIYDLNSLTLLSESTIIGKVEVEKNEDDSDWDYVNTASTISMNGLTKLIRKYDKNKVRPK